MKRVSEAVVGLAVAVCFLACTTDVGQVALDVSLEGEPEDVSAAETSVATEVGFADAAVDSAAPELVFEEVEVGNWDVDVGLQPGEAGYPCESGEECYSSYCIQTPNGKQCTVTCESECPFGWECAFHTPSLPDEVYVCVPQFLSLCRPCMTNEECMVNGADTGQACVSYLGHGNFCAEVCSGEELCPEPYKCLGADDVTGKDGSYCVLDDASCECNQWFADQGAWTTCYSENEWGVCEGERKCTADGLTDCDAPAPAPESCNGLDDDCDELVDEEIEPSPCLVMNQFGNCPGEEVCVEGEQVCQGEEAEFEACDGMDNDCDGMTDEGYEDTDGDGKANCIESDKDNDGILDGMDNCPGIFNPVQDDFDMDGQGDLCDQDDDNDMAGDTDDCGPKDDEVYPGAKESCDGKDNDCNAIVDEGYPDTDADGWKDCVDEDDDGDGALDAQDCAPLNEEAFPGNAEACDGIDNDCNGQTDEGFSDLNGNGTADCVDEDIDGDGAPNATDNCPLVANEGQEDADSDGLGDACDADADGDSIPDAVDNCLGLKNTQQADLDGDGLGDVCDDDLDGDGAENGADNCPLVANGGQADLDNDGTGDACEEDKDGDGVPDNLDCAPANGLVYPGAEEVCDGADNNCNSSVDEGFPDKDADGLKNCVDQDDDDDGTADEADCAPLNPLVHPAAIEICDGLDNNCDDKVDEGFGDISCGKGVCAHSVPACLDGMPQACDPLEGISVELCDGQDNDCDGLTDEDLGWVTCGKGECDHTVAACLGGAPNECDPMAGAVEELCDGLDNDCDGKVDEELATLACGKGA